MSETVDGWKQAQKLLPELQRILEFLGAIDSFKGEKIVAFSPASNDAFVTARESMERFKLSIQKDLRIVDSELRRVA